MTASNWKVRRQDIEYSAANFEELLEWVRRGKVAPSDYVFNPVLERWMYASEVKELVFVPSSAPKRTSPIALGCLVLLLLVGIGAVVENSKSVNPPDTTTLDAAMKKIDEAAVSRLGQHFYSSYEIQGDWVVIHINPAVWDSMSNSQQRQLCDILGNATFIKGTHLSGASLMVNQTLIGHVVRAGNLQRFSPALDSLK